jgi:hypothetical protein
MKLFVDFETRSEKSLKNFGLDVYAKHSSTEALMLGYAFDDEEPRLWEPRLGLMPDDLQKAITDPSVIKFGWNFNFEKDIFEFIFGIKTELKEWCDPSTLCAYMSLPIGLHRAGEALGISGKKIHITGDNRLTKMFGEKSKRSKKLIKTGMSELYYKDWDSHPEQWKAYKEYCLQDVRSEREIYYESLSFNCPMTDEENRAFELDQRMNETGIWIDQTFVRNAKNLAEKEATGILKEIKDITKADNPNSRNQILAWCKSFKYPFDSLDMTHVEEALKLNFLNATLRKVLELKEKLGGSAYKKLESILDRIGPDGRLRDQFVFMGAHTGRWCVSEGSPIRVKIPSGAVIDKPIETVALEDLVWDGEGWVHHEGVMFSGDKEVIKYDNVNATPEHMVWVTATRKIPLATADNLNLPLWRGKETPYKIYRLTSPSGRFYIGLTKSSLKTRWQQHKKKAEKTSVNHPLYNAIRKYGPNSFKVEIIDYTDTLENAQALEIKYIAESNKEKPYNLSPGGEGDGEIGSKIFWDKMNKNPELKKKYIQKLSDVKKENDWSDYKLMSEQNETWRKENPRLAYKMSYRAIRIASRNQTPKAPDTRPLIERLRWKHNRSKATRLAAIKYYKNQTTEQKEVRSKKISLKLKERFSKMTIEERRAATEKSRAVHVANAAERNRSCAPTI